MKILQTEIKWSGDGFGADYVLLKQVKRSDKAAIYERWQNKGAIYNGCEVFRIKMRHKGDKLPGGVVEAEDREVYPSANQFGISAWHVTRARAEVIFKELTEEVKEVLTPKNIADIVIPDGEFTCADFMELNKISQPEANKFLRENLDKTIKISKVSRKAGQLRGRPSNFYSKI